MNNPLTRLPLVLASVLAFAHLGVPTIAMAQELDPNPYCYNCMVHIEMEGDKVKDVYFSCSATVVNGEIGYLWCELWYSGLCITSSLPVWGGHDCLVQLALNGRVVTDTEWEPWPQAVATAAATRHECTGGIIQRPYSSGQIAEMRSGLRLIRI